MSTRCLRSIGLLALVPLLSSCGADQPEGPQLSRVDSAGMELVTLSGPGRALAWEKVEEWRVGGNEEGPTSFSSLHETLIETDSLGNIFVLDSQARHVVVLSSSGELVRVIGREGDGPGEFRRPSNLSAHPDGSLSVWDFSKGGAIRFTPDGEYRDMVQPEIRYQGPLLEMANDAFIYTQFSRGAGETIESSLVRFDGDGMEVMATLVQPPSEPVAVPGCPVRIPMTPVFFPSMVWDSEADRTAVTSGPGYEVSLFLGDRLAQKIRWDTPLREATRAMAVQELGDGFTIGLSSGPCTAPAAAMVDAQGYADFLPAVRTIKLSPHGEIWVERGRVKGEPRVIDVFKEGEYLGTLPPGFPFPAAFPTQDRILAVELDEFDVPYLVSYRVDRGSD